MISLLKRKKHEMVKTCRASPMEPTWRLLVLPRRAYLLGWSSGPKQFLDHLSKAHSNLVSNCHSNFFNISTDLCHLYWILITEKSTSAWPTHFILLVFLYSMGASENQKFSDVFCGCIRRPVAWNGWSIRGEYCELFFCVISVWRCYRVYARRL